MTHIVHLTTVHRPFDTRIFQKECRTLAQEGYRVSLIAPHTTNETIDGVQIIPIPRFKDRLARKLRMSWGIWAVYRLALRLKADLYHFHDPELMPAGILLKLTTCARVIYDVHENYPTNMQAKEWLPRPLRRLASWAVARLESITAAPVDGIVAATEYIAARFPPAKTQVVRNYPLLSMITEPSGDQRTSESNCALIYTGGLTNHRGAYQLVQAMGLVKTPQAKLILLGGYVDRETSEAVRNMPGWSRVDYRGQVSYEAMYHYLHSAAAGLICSQPVHSYDRAQPNKLFEYMSAGLPVIASGFEMWKQIVEDNGCGVTVDPTNPQQIAEAIDYLLTHPDMRRTMGENARRAVQSKYNWEHESSKLISLYQEVLGRC